MLTYYLLGFSIGLSAAASPGPFQAFVIGRALRAGWRRTLPIVIAPLLSDGPIITVMLLVLTRFPPLFLRVIQVAGGIFVLYLAWKSVLAWRDFRFVDEGERGATGGSLWQAVMMNFLSPGPYIFWSMIAGPALVRGWNEAPSHGVGFLLGFYSAMIGGLVAIVLLFGAARQLGPRVNRALVGISALALGGFGVYQLVTGIVG